MDWAMGMAAAWNVLPGMRGQLGRPGTNLWGLGLHWGAGKGPGQLEESHYFPGTLAEGVAHLQAPAMLGASLGSRAAAQPPS